MRTVFFLAAIPAVLVMILLAGRLKEPTSSAGLSSCPVDSGEMAPSETRSWTGLHSLGPNYHRFLLAVLVFALGNSTDAFLILKLTQSGVSPTGVAVLWSVFHLVKMTATYFGGRLSDLWGRQRMILAGWLVYAAVYLALAFFTEAWMVIALFLGYGLYFGLTEPAERALVADLVPENRRGAAFGWYHGAIGAAALPASLIFGALWQAVSPTAAFFTGAGLALAASTILMHLSPTQPSLVLGDRASSAPSGSR
jgi:MFS family permease